MARLDRAKQERLEPKRMEYAIRELEKRGFEITHETGTWVTFTYNGWPVKFFPYSGWHTGRSIKDGRGIENLLAQLDNKNLEI